MDPSLHRRTLRSITLRTRSGAVVAVDPAAVPGAARVRARDDLEQLAGMDVADLNEVPAEEEKPWRVECDRLGESLPVDGLEAARWLAVLLDVEAER